MAEFPCPRILFKRLMKMDSINLNMLDSRAISLYSSILLVSRLLGFRKGLIRSFFDECRLCFGGL